MADHRQRLGLGRRFRLTAGAMTVAVAVCLGAAGCSAIKSAASAQAPSTPGPSTSGAGLLLPNLGRSPSAIPSHDPLTGPPADPFAGTPADHWADGAAGIALPATTAVSLYSAAQVAYAYQATRKLLIAAYLNKQTLLGGEPTAFADLLTGSQKTWFEQGVNKKGVNKRGAPFGTRVLVMSFAPGSTQLIGSVTKVNGTMHAKATTDDGVKVLDIGVDYIFVYPIEPPNQPDHWMRIVSQVTWTVAFGNFAGATSSFAPWLVLASDGASSSVSGADCGTTDGFVHPAYPRNTATGAQPTATPSGAPIDPYVRRPTTNGGCQSSTGT